MKCPKCSYNSFELYDSCKKCGTDLAGFKQTHGIRPIVHPPQFIHDDSLPPTAFAVENPVEEDSLTETAAVAEAVSWTLPTDEPAGEDTGFAGFDLDFSMDDDKEDQEERPASAAEEDSMDGFGEFSFDDDTSSSELDDLLAEAEADTGLPASAGTDDFSFDDSEFSLESNSLSLHEDAAGTDEFDFDGLLTDEPPTAEEEPKKNGPSIELKDFDSDWPSFLETETKEDSDK